MQHPWYFVLIHALAFCSGFSIMGVELLGGRILAPYFGNSIHIWGSIITVFMLSLSLGYLFGGKLSRHRASLRRYGLLFVASGITLLPIAFGADPLMEWVFERIEDSRYGSLVASVILFVVPTVILGMISPYSVQLLVNQTAESGQVAGRLYFISTLGSALGTIMTSFYLVLWFEVNTIILVFCLLLIALGALAMTLPAIGVRHEQHAHSS